MDTEEKNKLLSSFKKKKEVLQKYINSAPFTRM